MAIESTYLTACNQVESPVNQPGEQLSGELRSRSGSLLNKFFDNAVEPSRNDDKEPTTITASFAPAATGTFPGTIVAAKSLRKSPHKRASIARAFAEREKVYQTLLSTPDATATTSATDSNITSETVRSSKVSKGFKANDSASGSALRSDEVNGPTKQKEPQLIVMSLRPFSKKPFQSSTADTDKRSSENIDSTGNNDIVESVKPHFPAPVPFELSNELKTVLHGSDTMANNVAITDSVVASPPSLPPRQPERR